MFTTNRKFVVAQLNTVEGWSSQQEEEEEEGKRDPILLSARDLKWALQICDGTIERSFESAAAAAVRGDGGGKTGGTVFKSVEIRSTAEICGTET